MKKFTLLDFEKGQRKKTDRWLRWFSLSLLVLAGQIGLAQINAYTFSQSTGAYQSIVADGTLVSGTDATAVNTYDTTGWDVTLPFDFIYNSLNYSSIFVNSNGGTTFGTPTSTSSSVISPTTAYAGAIAVMNRDLWGIFYTSGTTTTGSNVITNVASFKGIEVGKLLRTGSGVAANTTVTAFDETAGTITMSAPSTSTTAAASIGWGTGKILTKVDGVAPNRIFTIQWEGYNDYGATSTASNYLSFQLKLAETANTIQIVYGDYFNISTTSRTNQIGLRGATNADFNNRLGAAGNPWNNTSNGTANNSTVARDNVNFPASGLTFMWTPASCIPPGGLTATNITTNSALLGFTSPGSLFNLEWGTQGFVQGTGTTVTGITEAYSLSGLLPNTAYSFYVRQDCGTDGLSNWAGPFTFTTNCAPATTFSENFDTYTLTGSANPLPNCWSRLGNTGSSYIATASVAPMSPSNRLYLSGSATGATNGVAVMPPVSNLQAETHRLKFKAYCTTADKVLEIGYYEPDTEFLNFVVLETFPMPSTAASTALEFIYIPEFVVDGVQSLAFRANGGAFTGTTLIYIDDVIWEPIPSCPDIVEFEISDIGATTADIGWTPGGSETAWQYVYGLSSVTDPSTLTPIDVVNNPFISLTDLTSSTNYKLWVRSNCGNGVFGNWSTVINFITDCAPVSALPWTEGFEGITTVGTTAFPPCWSEQNGDWASALASTYNTPKSGTKYIRNSWSATNEYMWTPGFELTAGTSYDFSFHMQGDGFTGWNVDIFHNSVQNSVDAIQLGETIIAAGSGTIAVQPYALVSNTFIPATSGVYYFAIRVNQASGTPWYIAFDDFKMEVTPTCVAPITQATTAITSTTASVNWTSPEVPANGYEYFLTTDSAVVPIAATVATGTIPGTNSTFGLTTLTPATTYYFYIRALCSASDISSWSSAATFKTACSEVTDFSENFDSYTSTGAANPLPNCWLRTGNGATYITTGGAAPATPPNRLYMTASGVAAVPTVSYAIMPPVSNLQAGTHRLKFKAYASTTGKYVEIGYLTNIDDLTSFVLVETVDLPGTTAATAQTFTINPENIPAGINSLVFRNPGTPTAATTLYIDDVIWEVKPIVVPTCTTNIVATPNATCGNFATIITWDANPLTDGYNLTIGTTAGGNEVLNNQDLGALTTYSFIGTLNTQYFYTVTPYNSAGSALSCVEQTFMTAVNGCYCTSVPTSNDDLGITNVLLGTQNFTNGDVTYFDHTATTVDLPQGIISNLQVTLDTGFTYGTNVWIDFNDNFIFELNELVFQGVSTALSPTVLDASFLMPVNATLGTHRMRIVSTDIIQNPANPCYGGTYGVTLDFSVNIIPVPTCIAPGGLTVDSTSVTATTATVNWTPSTTLATGGYEYYYDITNTPPTDSTTPSGSVAAGITIVNLTDLTPATAYRVYVRSICNTTDTSDWSVAALFTTLCANYDAPFAQNFDNYPPLCWATADAGTAATGPTGTAAGIWTADGFLNVGTTGAVKVNLYGTNRIGWLITPPLSTTVGSDYSFSLNYGVTVWNATGQIAMGSDDFVKVMMTTDNGVTWTEVHTFNAASNVLNTSQEYVYDFVATSSAVKFALFASDGTVDDTQDYDFFVDNIAFDTNLSNVEVENNTFTAYPNPVKDNLNIRYNENITDVTVYNVLGQQLFVKVINATEGQVDLSNLTSGTYLVRVTSGDKTQTIKVIKE